MPLHKGSSKSVISKNVREMRESGHDEKQSVAAALANARKSGPRGKRGKRKYSRKTSRE